MCHCWLTSAEPRADGSPKGNSDGKDGDGEGIRGRAFLFVASSHCRQNPVDLEKTKTRKTADLAGFKDVIFRPSHLRSSVSVAVSFALLLWLTCLVSLADT